VEITITLDLPFPVSTNKLWRYGRGRVFKSDKYLNWCTEADLTIMSARAYPKRKITGQFKAEILLNIEHDRIDGDNGIKGLLDYCQSRDIVTNDRLCAGGSWRWVPPEAAPRGCRVILRSIHEAVS
jgi:Holliday junction resolvase RusA-like endonuclease